MIMCMVYLIFSQLPSHPLQSCLVVRGMGHCQNVSISSSFSLFCCSPSTGSEGAHRCEDCVCACYLQRSSVVLFLMFVFQVRLVAKEVIRISVDDLEFKVEDFVPVRLHVVSFMLFCLLFIIFSFSV